MALRREARPLDHGFDLATQQRDFAGAAIIGDRGEEAGKQPLADDFALGVEQLHPDRVEMNITMHCRAQIGLGHHHQIGLTDEVPDIGRHVVAIANAVEDSCIEIAQDAERGVIDDAIADLVALAGEGVFPVTEEGEIVIPDPAQKIDDLRYIRFWQRQFALGDVVDDASLGILRDFNTRIFDGIRNRDNMPPDVRNFIRQPNLMMVTKANLRSTVPDWD